MVFLRDLNEDGYNQFLLVCWFMPEESGKKEEMLPSYLIKELRSVKTGRRLGRKFKMEAKE